MHIMPYVRKVMKFKCALKRILNKKNFLIESINSHKIELNNKIRELTLKHQKMLDRINFLNLNILWFLNNNKSFVGI